LRRNCLVIGIIYIIWAIEHLGFGIGKLPLTCEAAFDDYNKEFGSRSHEIEEVNQRFSGSSGDSSSNSHGRSADQECKALSTAISILIVLVVFTSLFWLAAGVLLLLAVFKRIALAALVAGILILVGLLTYFVHMVTLFATIHIISPFDFRYYIVTFYNLKHAPGYDFLVFGMIAGCVIGTCTCMGLGIWSAICSIQLGTQISARVDLDPVEGKPVEVMASQQSVAIPSGYGSAAPPSFSQNPSNAVVENPSS
jgi:hypothetical protein